MTAREVLSVQWPATIATKERTSPRVPMSGSMPNIGAISAQVAGRSSVDAAKTFQEAIEVLGRGREGASPWL